MPQRVLIANRGEIALRIARAARTLGIETVAAYTRVDKDLRHLDLVDDHVLVAERSYLDIASLVMAAKARACDAVHPGYGFLSENAGFAQAVEDNGLIFVGPSPASIATMADKAAARRLAAEHGLATLAGSDDVIADEAQLRSIAARSGFPLLIKARGGGGGRGIRLVTNDDELINAWHSARQEADAAFGDDGLYVERFLPVARHIEVQVAGDGLGNAIHFSTRECSIQRSQQKLLEEAPAPGLDPGVAAGLCQQAAAFTAAIGYRGVGTLEFLYDGEQFHFIEMNTRLQVEHPVTEAITGVDLVQLQFELADGAGLPDQQGIGFSGHAIEIRVNAEDDEFRPSPGLVTALTWPGGPGVRIDSHLYAGYRVPHDYDSLVAKLIFHGRDREQALARAVLGVAETSITGIATNLGLQGRILASPDFAASQVHTRFVAQFMGANRK